MVDRISRSYVNYGMYQMHVPNKVAAMYNTEERVNPALLDADDKVRVKQYPTRSMEQSLIRAVEQSSRITNTYSSLGIPHLPPALDANSYTYLGRHIDIFA